MIKINVDGMWVGIPKGTIVEIGFVIDPHLGIIANRKVTIDRDWTAQLGS